jgi:transglutaminase-like putative cysteine protease
LGFLSDFGFIEDEMNLDRWFRLSCYLTLGLSCAALVFAESFFLPGLSVCLAPVLALLLLAWWVEGRWSLSVRGVNFLGLIIAAGGVTWLVTQVLDEDSLLSRVSPHLALVPYMGPLVMAALLVQVFRPRQPGDFWRLQGLGLVQVSLGCVLAAGPEFGALLAAYLASALTCLALHYRLSAVNGEAMALAAGCAASPPTRQLTPPLRPATPSLSHLIRFAFRWTLLIGVPAILLFLLTPRRDGSAWGSLPGFQSGLNRAGNPQTGSGEGINLNGTGTVELDDEAAFQVVARDAAGRPKLDLPGDQRWRGTVLDWYEDGKWTTVFQRPPRAFPGPRNVQEQLPDFGPGQYYLTFDVKPRRAGGLVLAEPIRLGPPDARQPVLSSNGRFPLFFVAADTVLPRRFSARREYSYRQVLPALSDPSRTPAVGLGEEGYLQTMKRQPQRLELRMQEWTVDLLRQLAEQPDYRLPAEVRGVLGKPWQEFLIEMEQWEPVAAALTDYLAHSGEFTYTLNLTRYDPTIDPVLDFLFHLKRGHCERYATALTLMLRSVGIPARVVKGFRGADNLGDGSYVVRHHHAHAWVEALVPRRGGPSLEFDWLTLDPTPGESAEATDGFSLSRWWQELRDSAAQLWQTLIVGYNADQQADLWDNLQSGHYLSALRKVGLVLLAVLVVSLGFVLLRRLPRRRIAPSPGTATFYRRLIQLLGRHTPLRPASAQTPREFGETARQFLQRRRGLAALAELPGRVVELLYRVRFGGRPLTEPEGHTLDAELDRLADAFRSKR